jgi:hypothetical protein
LIKDRALLRSIDESGNVYFLSDSVKDVVKIEGVSRREADYWKLYPGQEILQTVYSSENCYVSQYLFQKHYEEYRVGGSTFKIGSDERSNMKKFGYFEPILETSEFKKTRSAFLKEISFLTRLRSMNIIEILNKKFFRCYTRIIVLKQSIFSINIIGSIK